MPIAAAAAQIREPTSWRARTGRKEPPVESVQVAERTEVLNEQCRADVACECEAGTEGALRDRYLTEARRDGGEVKPSADRAREESALRAAVVPDKRPRVLREELHEPSMSEYQCYEFVALDRPLTPKQMAELRAISTRAEITPTRFWNEYQWGDLKADPAKLVERYFDAHMYFANWGTHRLMLRVPSARVPKGTLRDRREDVLSPEVLVRRHAGYRCRVLMGPSFRADVWTALERAPDLSIAEIARKASCSFATAWQAAQDYRLLRDADTNAAHRDRLVNSGGARDFRHSRDARHPAGCR